jgi:FkbM family methyltransferase
MTALAEPITADPIGAAMRSTQAAPSLRGPIVLYGAGQLGRWTAQAMRGAGPFCFCDSNPKLWHTEIEGVPVLPIQDVPNDALFVVTIYTGAKVRKQLRDQGQRVVSFAEFYRASLLGQPAVAVPYGSIDSPEAIRAHESEIRDAYGLWADSWSKAEYLAQVRYRISLEEPTIPSLPPAEMYFPPEQPFAERECFVDGGAFDGDTVKAFLQRREGRRDRIIAIEPDPANADKLCTSLHGQSYRVIHAAIGDKVGSMRFDATGTAGSRLSPDGKICVAVTTLDEALEHEKPTRIKLDIEGAEVRALEGARKILARDKPMLAVCLYHAPEHLWEVPRLLKSIVPDYDLYLRRYSDDCWETVCYAVAR